MAIICTQVFIEASVYVGIHESVGVNQAPASFDC